MTVDASNATLRALEAAQYAINSKEHSDDISIKFGVPSRTIRRAKSVLLKGIPEVIDAVKAGKMTITNACELAKVNKKQQKRMYSSALEDREQQSAKTKKLTDGRIENIKRIVEEMKKCCDGAWVNHFGIQVYIKELDEFCYFLLNNKKQPKVVVNVIDVSSQSENA